MVTVGPFRRIIPAKARFYPAGTRGVSQCNLRKEQPTLPLETPRLRKYGGEKSRGTSSLGSSNACGSTRSGEGRGETKVECAGAGVVNSAKIDENGERETFEKQRPSVLSSIATPFIFHP